MGVMVRVKNFSAEEETDRFLGYTIDFNNLASGT